MSLSLKYRPSGFSEIKGNENIVASLRQLLSNVSSCPHTFLFHGDTGCGKTTLARIVAKELNCSGIDLKELNSADYRGIDTIREIRKNIGFKPIESRCCVYIIDEVHKWTNDAQNAILKPLEDTPKHIYFILCTTDPNKLIKAIRGRCIEYQVKPLDYPQMVGLLRWISKQEGIVLDNSILKVIYENSTGLPRNAINILEQVISSPEELRLEVAEKYSEEVNESIELCKALIYMKPWGEVSQILKGLKDQDTEGIRRHVMGYANAVLLGDKTQNNTRMIAALVLEYFVEPFYTSGFPGLSFACFSIINDK